MNVKNGCFQLQWLKKTCLVKSSQKIPLKICGAKKNKKTTWDKTQRKAECFKCCYASVCGRMTFASLIQRANLAASCQLILWDVTVRETFGCWHLENRHLRNKTALQNGFCAFPGNRLLLFCYHDPVFILNLFKPWIYSAQVPFFEKKKDKGSVYPRRKKILPTLIRPTLYVRNKNRVCLRWVLLLLDPSLFVLHQLYMFQSTSCL